MIRASNTRFLSLRSLFVPFLLLALVVFEGCDRPIIDDDLVPKSIKEYHIDCDMETFNSMFEHFEEVTTVQFIMILACNWSCLCQCLSRMIVNTDDYPTFLPHDLMTSHESCWEKTLN